MAWIESHQSLAAHPKTRRLARLLGVSRPAAIGHLHLLWWWSLDYAQDGDLSRFDPDDLADAAEWDDDPASFMEGLRRAGFLDDDARIHDWHDYAGRLVSRRNANAERMRAARASNVQDTSGVGVEPPYQPTVPTNSDPTEPDQPTNLPAKPDVTGKNADEIMARGRANKPTSPKYTPEFQAIYARYPHVRGSKAEAFKAWQKVSLDEQTLQDMEYGLSSWLVSEDWTKDGGKYVMAMSRWVNGRYWESPPRPANVSPFPGHTIVRGKDIGYSNEDLDRLYLEAVQREQGQRAGSRYA